MANKETCCRSLGGRRMQEVKGVTACETQDAPRWQTQLLGLFEERNDLRRVPGRPLDATEALVVQ